MSFGVLDGDGQVAQIEGHPFGRISFTGQRFPTRPTSGCCRRSCRARWSASARTTPHIERWGGHRRRPDGAAAVPEALHLGHRPRRRHPHPPGSTNVHHEVELAVVIGARGARNVTPEQAAASIFGYTIGNDVSERDMQQSDGQWTRAKGFDSFCPLGPWIETDLGALGLDLNDLEITCTVDGEPRRPHQPADLDPVPRLLHLPGHDAAAGRHRPHRHAVRGRPDPPGSARRMHGRGPGTLSNTVAAAEAVSTAGGTR